MAPKSTAQRIVSAPVGVATSPITAGALLYGILYQPQRLLSVLPTKLHPLITSPRFITVLKGLVTLGVIRAVSSKLSDLVVNNWKGSSKFIKSQELILITGGSGGIGEAVAKGFSKLGVKVIIVDVKPPTNPLRKSPYPVIFISALDSDSR
jgi:hypothetical protein